MAQFTFASFKAPYHANALAQLYNQNFFSLQKLDKLVKAGAIKKYKNFLFMVGGYTRANGYSQAEIVPLYNRLANAYKKTIITFAGSDIIQYNSLPEKVKNGFKKFLRRPDVVVAAVGDYMAKEVLDTIGIAARVLYMPLNHKFSGKIYPLPKNFTVGCYMPKSGNEFYGYSHILGAVKEISDVEFHFYSLLGYPPNKEELSLKNLVCYRDPIKDMETFLKNISCGIRVTQHDGNPMSLAEYNIAGRWFIFNKEMPYCHSIDNNTTESIVKKILEVREIARDINVGSNFYLKRHDNEKFFNNINKIYGIK